MSERAVATQRVTEGVAAGAAVLPSAWAPFASQVFKALWAAQFVSNIGTWMQNVAAVWLMGSLGGSALLVALVQTATLLPVFLVGVPAGALADIVDRRRLLVVTQLAMLVAAAGLAGLDAAHRVTPGALLAFTFALGLGSALNLPAWQAIQPELVPRSQFAQAIALNGVNMNAARAIGPAIGGVIVAALGSAAVFALNGVSFLAVLVVVVWWRRPPTEAATPRETLVGAVRAGFRYGLHSPTLRGVLYRTVCFCVPVSAVTALLPVLARGPLHLGPGGYGILLGCFGFGAVLSAVLLPRLRARWSTDAVVAGSIAALAGVLGVLAGVHLGAVVALALVVGGAGWTLTLSSFNVAAQGSVPDWVRARGMGLYLLAFQGSFAAGSALWGVVAEENLSVAFGAAAGLLAAGLLVTRRWPLGRSEQLDLRPSPVWPDPVVVLEPAPGQGPVLVTLEYRVPSEKAEAFFEGMRRMEHLRRRTGARRWNLYRDTAVADRYVETFMVDSWEEHLRQHQRYTATDQMISDQLRSLASEPLRIEHLLSVY
ncbi:MAG: MFS transporter [Actinobacteria bacterium]|nr:MFS transporter [Actinomycetota bacterium]